MANTELGLLRYPVQWQGATNCSPQYFLHVNGPLYQTQAKVCAHNIQRCNQYGMQHVRVCTCHGFCQYHCNPSSVTEDQKWKTIIAPYLNIAVVDPWSEQVLSDASRKLSALDPVNGLGVLHGLLISGDDATLLEWFLELGVDADMRFIHSNINNYAGPASFDVAVAKKLNFGTAAHFAAHFERNKCLEVLVDVGTNLALKTQDGKTPLDLAKNGSVKIIRDAVAKNGAKTFAQLAREEKYFAVRYKMRSGKATPADLQVQCGGKTALEWIWVKMTEWQFAMKMDQDSLMAFKIMAEMRYRYDAAAAGNLAPVPSFSLGTADGGLDKLKKLPEEVKKLWESQQTILESICVLSGEMKKLKMPNRGGADGGQ